MSYFKKLNLPINPLKNSKEVTQRAITAGYNIVLPNEVLTSEVLDIFKNIGLRPKMVVLFGRGDSTSSPKNRMIHADIAYDDNVPENWRKLVAGVNWEIEGSHNDFYWYDMTGIKECWPVGQPVDKSKFNYLNGIHFGERFKMGIPENAKLLDQTTIDGPTLVRTDIPHATLFNNPNTVRVGVSVRFFEEDFNHSWEGALDKFTPLIKE
jgi:hypothetical protein